jgi:Reverse transcriptase (RNA-dependent DNA polymerase)
MVRTTVEYFLSKGSSVFLAALDIRKPFDSVRHDKLFICLLKQGVPLIIVDVLRNWYSKISVNI